MGDWLDKLAAESRERSATKELDGKLQLYRQEIIQRKSGPLWRDLLIVVERDVRKFEGLFRGDKKRAINFSSNERHFRVHKDHYPAVMLDVEMQLGASFIRYQYAETENDHSGTERSEGELIISVDSVDNLQLSHPSDGLFSSLDQVSEFVLRPVFSAE